MKMRKVLLLMILCAGAMSLPAQAKPPKPHPSHPAKSHKCVPHAVGYRASGELVSVSLTPTAGAATPERGDDRYSGTITVNVTKANHHAPKGNQTYTLANVRVKFRDQDHNQVPDQPQAGDRVKLSGKITKLSKKCDQSGFTATPTVRKVDFKHPKPPRQ
jgi:hypothetical protein